MSDEPIQQPCRKQTPLRSPPSTRYQGSKRKLLKWIEHTLRGIAFDSVLDLFSGTGSVAYLFKSLGKSVTCNDYLRANYEIGTALIENGAVRLADEEADFVCCRHGRVDYDDFIARTFAGIYFTDEENAWLDMAAQNIRLMPDRVRRALAYAALFQACLRKRPYNLFHRRNLYMRTATVRRGFGNKATWDSPFEAQFRHFVGELNESIFDGAAPCRALCMEACLVPSGFDLVYIDPPYVNGAGTGVDYFEFYHFLEGLLDYPDWGARIDADRKHLPLRGERSRWSDARTVRDAFAEVFERHAGSTLVVSYRSDGVPSEQELGDLLRRVKPRVRCFHYGEYKYALSTNGASRELLFVAE